MDYYRKLQIEFLQDCIIDPISTTTTTPTNQISKLNVKPIKSDGTPLVGVKFDYAAPPFTGGQFDTGASGWAAQKLHLQIRIGDSILHIS